MTDIASQPKLTSGQFSIQGMPGIDVIIGFGFDPEKCVVYIDEYGNLVITEEDGPCDFMSQAGLWTRTDMQ